MGWVSTVNPFQRRRGCTEKSRSGPGWIGAVICAKSLRPHKALRDKFFEVLNML